MRNEPILVRVGLVLAMAVLLGENRVLAEEVEPDLIEAMTELEDQLNQMVVSGAKTAQRLSEAPAVITVITADEIQYRGYTSVAEALRTVPGFYDVYDLVSHNIGVRGVNGGDRAAGSIVKVMIDGQVVNYRPSTGNYLGVELVPMAAIDRIEVVRGPASALYGANAFLGAINIITKSGGQIKGVRLSAQGSFTQDHPGYGYGIIAGASDPHYNLMFAYQTARDDRSGMEMPSDSPILDRRDFSGNTRSQNDLNKPSSMLAKISVGDNLYGHLSFWASKQTADSNGEFQDVAPLTHDTRIATQTKTYRIGYQKDFDKLSFSLSYSRVNSAPSDVGRFDLNDPTTFSLPNEKADCDEYSAELHARPFDSFNLTLGLDRSVESHTLLAYDSLLRVNLTRSNGTIINTAGTRIPGTGSGRGMKFTNNGVYVQGIWQFLESMSLTAGVRLDRNNAYGNQFSPRAGLAWSPITKPYYLKLLYGSAFKTPSAEQLYAQPMQTYDIQGNSRVSAQTAKTGELAGGLRFSKRGELMANIYFTSISGRVEFVQQALFLTAKNVTDETYGGGEVDVRYQFVPSLSARLGVGIAHVISRTRSDDLALGPEVDQPLFPVYQAHLITDWHLPWWGLRLSPEVSLIGPRGSSQSNALVQRNAYQLPSYVYTALSLSLPERKLLADRFTSVTLRINNVLGTKYTDPGFGGVDIPGLGRVIMLSITQGL